MKFMLWFIFGACAIANCHIIIYGTGPENKCPGLDFVDETFNHETQVEDFKTQLRDIILQVNALANRVDRLESAEGEKADTTIRALPETFLTTPKATTNNPKVYRCPNGWVPYNSSCYYFDTKDVNFESAERVCSEQDAHMIHVESKEENTFLKNYLINNLPKKHRWIGLTDEETEGVWKLTGTDIVASYFDWNSIYGFREPEGGRRENCVVMHYSYYKWVDTSCSSMYRTVCEKSAEKEGIE